jgi:hypothetical protein
MAFWLWIVGAALIIILSIEPLRIPRKLDTQSTANWTVGA